MRNKHCWCIGLAMGLGLASCEPIDDGTPAASEGVVADQSTAPSDEEGFYCDGTPSVPDCESSGECVFFQYPESLCNPAFIEGGDGAVFSMTVLIKETVTGDCSVPMEQSGREEIDHTWYLVEVGEVLRGTLDVGEHWIYTAGADAAGSEGGTKGPPTLVPLEEGDSVVVVAWWDEQTQAKGDGAWLIISDGQVFREADGEWSYGVHYPSTGAGTLEKGLDTLTDHFAGMDDGSIVCAFQQESTFSGEEEHYPGWGDDATPVPPND